MEVQRGYLRIPINHRLLPQPSQFSPSLAPTPVLLLFGATPIFHVDFTSTVHPPHTQPSARFAALSSSQRHNKTANMFMARSEYGMLTLYFTRLGTWLICVPDRGINTFSPEGRLFQVEYSLEAIKLGSTAIGVATSEGVILGVEKRVTSTLLETSSVEKIVEIDRHIGCAMSGLQADARSMVEHARVECQSHAFNYNEPLRVESCTQAICDLALRFGEGADGEETIMSRPFGVALLIAGFDEDGPQLFHAEPSGTFYRYDAKAIGSGSEGAQAELQNEYHKSLTLTDAETLVLKTLKQVMEEKLDAKNVQLASVTREKGFRIYTDEEMATVVERLPAN
ncbi:proteasome component PUP2 [Fusarium albosuccineum]|uniref:Proteasome component PUP2 n=1 Tax=Fusarium albosuccineum TaxID=1237068 RepID=A0A8H4LM66_9HYPO|nr:proteasome component PUP2 [Fusarium albosuccineum]